jgi:hypothetical protein
VIYLLTVVIDVWAWRSWLFWIVWVIAIATALYGLALLKYHQSHPCETCIGDMPLNAHQVAEQRMRSLKLFHLASAPPLTLVWITVLAVALMVPHPVRVLLIGVLAAVNLISWTVTWRHRPLQPVCPWCRWGGGDDDPVGQPTPAPDPAGAKTA